MKIKLFMTIAILGIVVLFSSCANVPHVKVNAVTAAVDSVKSVGVDVFLPEVYTALTDSLTSINAQIETEKAKWFPTYKKVEVSLDLLAQTASDALVQTETRKTELKTENDALVTEVKGLLVSNGELLNKAPKGKEGREALAAIKADLELAATTVTEAEALIANNDILGANNKLKAVKEKVDSIKTELENAINKVK
jgi:hypothetical protein